jgi:hypothetical protein
MKEGKKEIRKAEWMEGRKAGKQEGSEEGK